MVTDLKGIYCSPQFLLFSQYGVPAHSFSIVPLLWTASLLPAYNRSIHRLPAHDGAILRTASS